MKETDKKKKLNVIYIVSGGSGTSASQIVDTLLAQFPDIQVKIVKKPHVRKKAEIKSIVEKASKSGAILIHTLVNNDMRKALIDIGEKQNLMTIDLMHPLMNWFIESSGQQPIGKPGLYRKQRQEHFDRITAIEFAIAHDDGLKPENLPSADIVLTGVSRSGKTPLSMYMAVQGWKVANVPLVEDMPPPPELFKVDHRRVVGLSISHEQLLQHRRKRRDHMGKAELSYYTDSRAVSNEMENARKIFKKGKFHVIDVTDKPIETTALEVSEYLNKGFKGKPYKRRLK